MNIKLLTVVNTIINKKQISWEFGIDNARLVTKHAVGGNSISEMLFSGYYDFSGVLVPTFGFTETAFLEKLKIKHWSYTDFILSAILFCIKHELTYGASSFLVLSKNIVYLLFDKNTLGEEVFNVLKCTNLFFFYKRDTVSGISSFFFEMTDTSQGYGWNTLGVFRILSLFHFYFTPSFIDKCVADCMEQNTLGPLILALYALKAKLVLSSASQSESFPIINNFKAQRAFLKKKKYLSNRFFFNLFFEKKYIKHFYGSNIETKLKQSVSIGLILAFFLGCTVPVIKPKLVSSVHIQTQTPPLRKNPLILQKNRNQTNPSFLGEPIKSFNRPRLTVYSENNPLGSILGAGKDKIENHNVEIICRSVYVQSRKITYEYFIVIIDGIHYFCPYGIYGQYKNLKYDMDHSIIPDAIKYFAERKLPFIYLGNYTKFQLDHVLKQCFRDALHISEDKAYAVVVPPNLNADRTNKKPKFEFCLFDIRIPSPWIVGKMPPLLQRLENNMFESLLWTRTSILYELNDPALIMVVAKIEDGYNYAITREMLFARAFVEGVSPIKNLQKNDSSVGFLLELLLQARKEDLKKMEIYKDEYIQSTNKLISKNFFIRQVVVAAEVQIRTSQALCELIKDSSARTLYKRKHEQLTRELQDELSQFKNSYSTNSSFDNAEAEFFLKRLYDWKNPNEVLDELLSVDHNQYVNLEHMCNTTLQLGNSYSSNGRILDISLGAARDLAKQSQLSQDHFIEQSGRKPVETLLFPQPSKLTIDEYDKLIQKQDSKYAKMALKKTHPNAVNEHEFLRDLAPSRSILEDENIDNMRENKDEFPSVPGNPSRSAQPRVTPDDERLARLLGNQSQNVPPIQNN